jgi:hypothetical protein
VACTDVLWTRFIGPDEPNGKSLARTPRLKI